MYNFEYLIDFHFYLQCMAEIGTTKIETTPESERNGVLILDVEAV